MKKALLSILCIIFLFSCKKEKVDQPIIPEDTTPHISFDLGKNHLYYSGGVDKVDGGKVVTPTSIFYLFVAFQNHTQVAALFPSTTGDTLKVKTYHITSGGTMFAFNGLLYFIRNNLDYVDLVVTSYKEGIVNATFSGKVSDQESEQTIIANGIIKNVKIRY